MIQEMDKIHPNLIDAVAEELNELPSAKSERLIDQLTNEQPAVLQYLFSNQFDFLEDEAKEMMLFTILVIWQVFKRSFLTLKTIKTNSLDEIQDGNWKTIEGLTPISKHQSFEEYVEPVIAEHPQSELLYFVIDAMEQDFDPEFTIHKESKVPIFVGIKSIIDTWIKL